jgi:6-pyruvoyltetrahydropterin/6-carboxytetrahydropterin synthase
MPDPNSRPIVSLVRRESFSAAHRLWADALSEEENHRLYGPCARPHGHGHNFDLEVSLKGPIDPVTGVIVNLADLRDTIRSRIIDHVDQRHLNYDCALTADINPTVENLVVRFWDTLVEVYGDLLHELRLRETASNWTVYRGERG